MPPPTRHEVAVATKALRTEAGVWDKQSTALAGLVGKTADLRLGRIEAGVFQLIVGPYDGAADQLTARCREGAQQMTSVANTLRHIATIYAEEDERNAHKLRNLY